MAEGTIDWSSEKLLHKLVPLNLLKLGLLDVHSTTSPPQGSCILRKILELLWSSGCFPQVTSTIGSCDEMEVRRKRGIKIGHAMKTCT